MFESLPYFSRDREADSDSAASSFDPHHASRFAVLSALAYKPDVKLSRAHAPRLGFASESLDSLQQRIILLSNPDEIVVSCKGSVLSDLSQHKVNFTHNPVPHPLGGRVHKGFYARSREATTSASADAGLVGMPLADAFLTRLQVLHEMHPSARIHFTGHSSGASMAALLASHLAEHDGILAATRVDSINGFAAPRHANAGHFAAFDQFYKGKYHRFAIKGDSVPHLPVRGYGLYYDYIDGAPTHRVPMPPLMPSAVSRRYEEEREKSPSRLRAALKPIEQHVMEHHGIHNYIRAYVRPHSMRDKEYYRSLLDTPQELEEYSPILAFDGAMEAHMEHFSYMLRHPLLRAVLEDSIIDVLHTQATRIDSLAQKEPYEQLAGLRQASRDVLNYLPSASGIDEVEALREYGGDIIQECERALMQPRRLVKQFANALMALSKDAQDADSDTLRLYSQRMKLGMDSTHSAKRFIHIVRHARHVLESRSDKEQLAPLIALAQSAEAELLRPEGGRGR